MLKIFKRKEKNSKEDLVDVESMYTVVKNLGIRGYKLSHFKTCKRIWKNLVPPSGQADSLQGELLRQAEKLRDEAIRNGNLNWDENFEWFCEFIAETLQGSNLFDQTQMETITGALSYIKECGKYAYRYNMGEISDDDVNPMLFAYTDGDLYDYVEDAIAIFAENNPDRIPYEAKDFVYR